MRRYAAKRDENERPIIQALLFAGWSVFPLSAPGLPDLMCVRRGRVVLLEVKMPGKKLTPAQRATFPEFAAAGLEPRIVTSPEDALAKVRETVAEPEPFDADDHSGRKAGGR